jgi:phospholipase/carboxylesterase
MLETLTHVPRPHESGNPTLVLLHGRGSNMHDLHQFARMLPETWNLVSPQAPFPGGPWGYGPGWAWYRYLAEDRVVEDTLGRSLEELELLLETLPDLLGTEPGPVVLGGFSQGGTTATAFALTHPGTIPMVLNFSGFVVDAASVPVSRETVEGTRFFWGHGLADPAIPFSLGARGRARLREAGADLETFDHPSGHTITLEELEAAIRWISAHPERARRSP